MSKLAPVRRRVEIGGKIGYLDIAYWPDEDRFDVSMPLTDHTLWVKGKEKSCTDPRPGRASRIQAYITPGKA